MKIIYTRPDGGISVVHPAEGQRLVRLYIDGVVGFDIVPFESMRKMWVEDGNTFEWAETPAEFMQRVASRSIPLDATNIQVVEDTEIPPDRTFRNAWKQNGLKVEHDIQKCREIVHTKRRIDRAKVFAPLDIEATIPALAVQAEAKRQIIRDYDAVKQIAIDAATTVEQLKALL